jgi:hypothetical protein
MLGFGSFSVLCLLLCQGCISRVSREKALKIADELSLPLLGGTPLSSMERTVYHEKRQWVVIYKKPIINNEVAFGGDHWIVFVDDRKGAARVGLGE